MNFLKLNLNLCEKKSERELIPPFKYYVLMKGFNILIKRETFK